MSGRSAIYTYPHSYDFKFPSDSSFSTVINGRKKIALVVLRLLLHAICACLVRQSPDSCMLVVVS